MGLHLLSAICGCENYRSAGRQSKQTEQRHEQQCVGAGLGQLIDREVCYLDGYKQFTLNGEATFIGRLGQKLVAIGGSNFRQPVKPLRVQTGKGCDTACLDTMLKMQPERIVYVSCDSATLARDVKYLREGGYELTKWRAVDQFGMTVHVEVACCLQRKNM